MGRSESMTIDQEGAVAVGRAVPVPADDADFNDFVATNHTALCRFAYLVTGNREDAQDAVQDALAGIFRRWGRVRQAERLAYVKRSIVNASISAWRKHRREKPIADFETLAGGTVPDPGQAVIESDRMIRLLLGLPARQRTAIVLRYYEDRDFPEIARICGCTEIAARGLVKRALATLRDQVDRDD